MFFAYGVGAAVAAFLGETLFVTNAIQANLQVGTAAITGFRAARGAGEFSIPVPHFQQCRVIAILLLLTLAIVLASLLSEPGFFTAYGKYQVCDLAFTATWHIFPVECD